jgi:hypothetical protein|nr:MAG TPA: hypothetical protein [Caudoviricetes sp.]
MEELKERLKELKECIYRIYPMTQVEFETVRYERKTIPQGIIVKVRYFNNNGIHGYSRAYGIEALQTKKQVIRAGEHIIQAIQEDIYNYLMIGE